MSERRKCYQSLVDDAVEQAIETINEWLVGDTLILGNGLTEEEQEDEALMNALTLSFYGKLTARAKTADLSLRAEMDQRPVRPTLEQLRRQRGGKGGITMAEAEEMDRIAERDALRRRIYRVSYTAMLNNGTAYSGTATVMAGDQSEALYKLVVARSLNIVEAKVSETEYVASFFAVDIE